MAFVSKDKTDILRIALQKLQETTPITAIGPGSVARALTEVVVNELGDLYGIMDFNTSMGVLSTAQGRALDLLAELYGLERKRLGEIATIDQSVGAFYFYLGTPYGSDILIPSGTRVYTDSENYIGEEYSYVTTQNATIPAGRTRVYVSIRPAFTDSVFTAGANTITRHSLMDPADADIRCTNPKPIAPQIGYETDDNFRTRIVKEVRTSAGGTADALRFAGLAVNGVRDVRIRTVPYGLGSVEALVVSEERSFAGQVMSDVSTQLEKAAPVGVRLFIREPDYTSCEVYASIIVRKDLRVDPEGTARRVEIGILRYLNRLLPGEPLIFTQLVQSAMDASDAVADVSITRLRMSGTEVLRRNYQPESDQQIVPGEIKVLSAS